MILHPQQALVCVLNLPKLHVYVLIIIPFFGPVCTISSDVT